MNTSDQGAEDTTTRRTTIHEPPRIDKGPRGQPARLLVRNLELVLSLIDQYNMVCGPFTEWFLNTRLLRAGFDLSMPIQRWDRPSDRSIVFSQEQAP